MPSIDPDTWADVKRPGDGVTYAVGTTWSDVDPVTVLPYDFSGVAVQPPPGFPLQGPKQVVILQAADANGIMWQRLFYGGNNITQGVYARGISVFPMPTTAATRIAICGETYDRDLPLATAPNVMPANFVLPLSSGFVAVYNGDGVLLWSYQFFGNDPFAATVISDVSIRVNAVPVPPVDVVTYCGASTNGRFVDPAIPSFPRCSPCDPSWRRLPSARVAISTREAMCTMPQRRAHTPISGMASSGA